MRLEESFEVDPELSSTNTDYGGEDPAKLPEGETATFNPEAKWEGAEL